MHPDEPLRCLLVQTKFPEQTFWNFRIACEVLGAKAPSPPLGLLTVAALLPQQWHFKLLDLNTSAMDDGLLLWADIVCIGGMLPQQSAMLRFIDLAKSKGKFVVAGGADPSSQPSIYAQADALVLGEGELSIPIWLNAWRQGKPKGIFKADAKPDVTQTPIPKYELLNLRDYCMIGVQYSRGCPFNCEFCDIIELFGRVPRTKTPPQLLAELDKLYALGYRGTVDLVDDNFIGNKRAVKRDLMPALIDWNRRHYFAFNFNTEASMNLADDRPLLAQMREANFRVIFMGIETPDPEVLLKTQKSQNTVRPIVERVHVLYEYGMYVTAGFIMGFDNEKEGTDKALIECIEEGHICMAMVGLLTALPNTQLTKRLKKEGRLLNFAGEPISAHAIEPHAVISSKTPDNIVDNTTGGLNFITKRNRIKILTEYLNVVNTIYAPKVYLNRVLRVAKLSKFRRKAFFSYRHSWKEICAMVRIIRFYNSGKTFQVRWLFWRNFLWAFWHGPEKIESVLHNMAIYLHFMRQLEHVNVAIREQIDWAKAYEQASAESALAALNYSSSSLRVSSEASVS